MSEGKSEGLKRARPEDLPKDAPEATSATTKKKEEQNPEGSDDEFGPAPISPEEAARAAARARRRAARAARARASAAATARAAASVPCAAQYERSYMHRSRLTHVRVVQPRSAAVAASTASRSYAEAAGGATFVVTASDDGHVKFWRKGARGVEFVKHFVAHPPGVPVAGVAASADGATLATCAARDGTVKVFDVAAWDLAAMLCVLPVHPVACALLQRDGRYLALADRGAPRVCIYDLQHPACDTDGRAQPVATLATLHTAPVLFLAHNAAAGMGVSVDAAGAIAYWDAAPPFRAFQPAARLAFAFAAETDLYALAARRVVPLALEVSPDGTRFAVVASDGVVRVFDFATGKIIREFDESLAHQEALAAEAASAAATAAESKTQSLSSSSSSSKPEGIATSEEPGNSVSPSQAANPYALDSMDLGRRVATEKDIAAHQSVAAYTEALDHTVAEEREVAENATGAAGTTTGKAGDSALLPLSARWNAVFDSSGRLLLYPTLVGVKVVDIATGRLVRVLGGAESATRFMQLALFEQGAGTPKADPTLFCTAWRQPRVYLLTNREPLDEGGDSTAPGRDVLNERVSAHEAAQAQQVRALTSTRLARQATIHTSLGDIYVQLFPDECPRTVENFTVHSQNGYYNGVLFHRVIKGFMIQTGDPKGDGTGGESIWGGDFEDEFCKTLKHDRPFTVSMANAGPNTNGSQFFITTMPVPRLDGKHTVFGRVFRGKDVVTMIEDVKTRKRDDRPTQDIRILSIDTSLEPPPSS